MTDEQALELFTISIIPGKRGFTLTKDESDWNGTIKVSLQAEFERTATPEFIVRKHEHQRVSVLGPIFRLKTTIRALFCDNTLESGFRDCVELEA
jgi:hypothetical protein